MGPICPIGPIHRRRYALNTSFSGATGWLQAQRSPTGSGPAQVKQRASSGLKPRSQNQQVSQFVATFVTGAGGKLSNPVLRLFGRHGTA